MCGRAPRQLGRALPQALNDWTRTGRRDEGQRVPADRFKACTFENRHSTAVSSSYSTRRESRGRHTDSQYRDDTRVVSQTPVGSAGSAPVESNTRALWPAVQGSRLAPAPRGQPASTARSLRGSQRQSGRPGPRCTPPSQRSVAGRVERPAITSTPADVMAYLPSANRLTSGARSSATAHSGRSLIHGGRSLTATATNNSLADRGANRNAARISRSSRDTPLRTSGSSASSRLNAGTPAHGRGSGERRAAKASGRGWNRRRRRHAVYRLRSARCGTETSHTGAE
jgi:hypothetical protein